MLICICAVIFFLIQSFQKILKKRLPLSTTAFQEHRQRVKTAAGLLSFNVGVGACAYSQFLRHLFLGESKFNPGFLKFRSQTVFNAFQI